MFELEDLLRTFVEMLGKSGLGTVYKVMLDDGNVVVIKRLKDAQIIGKMEFEPNWWEIQRLPCVEASDGRKHTQKPNMYSFGVLLLEMLIGKFPYMVDSGINPLC
ncbi:unnamed protein product [Sphenostylis stenocarpa]|uniref:Protein kinase domain-containing protein n=1 Tax=Sphenostylis stenocarpa TaxID=92480 RepID=A0AA86SFZ4_9FABA|nr:unnamed protein product [Sphenostylis stenocarpa]